MGLKIKLTELEKTILLIFLVFSKREKYLSEGFILSKFVPRQRKMARISMKRLIKNNLLLERPIKKSYNLTKEGLKQALKLLYEGAKLWKL